MLIGRKTRHSGVLGIDVSSASAAIAVLLTAADNMAQVAAHCMDSCAAWGYQVSRNLQGVDDENPVQ
jgi:hypothetical protein